jgi:hypothetical protein
MFTFGAKIRFIPEAYTPSQSVSPDRALVSHVTACILNAGDRDAQIAVTLYFEDRDPVGPHARAVSDCRTRHLRSNDLSDPWSVPRDTSYASVIEPFEPSIVQHTCLDSRRTHIAWLSRMAWTSV